MRYLQVIFHRERISLELLHYVQEAHVYLTLIQKIREFVLTKNMSEHKEMGVRIYTEHRGVPLPQILPHPTT